MKSTREMIEVMEASERGEKIEYKDSSGEWARPQVCTWNWRDFDYRVAPKPLECYLIMSNTGVLNATYLSRILAHDHLKTLPDNRLIKMREVTE